ncbi:MAG: hypothetical protein ACJA1A_000081 [Saprospiraceae bacterium]|jgi:hypothetical protein
MSNQTNELLWSFKYIQTYLNLVEIFFGRVCFSFVEKNNWYCGGGENMGMYDLDNKTSTKELTKSLLDYLSNHHSIVESITIENYIEPTDSFVDKKTILIKQIKLLVLMNTC